MSISQLPKEIILDISQYLRYEYLNEDMIEDIEDENLKQLLIENKGDNYYPVYNLYITCKSFQWLSELEYIHFDLSYFGEDIRIRTRNIYSYYNRNNEIKLLKSILFNIPSADILIFIFKI